MQLRLEFLCLFLCFFGPLIICIALVNIHAEGGVGSQDIKEVISNDKHALQKVGV